MRRALGCATLVAVLATLQSGIPAGAAAPPRALPASALAPPPEVRTPAGHRPSLHRLADTAATPVRAPATRARTSAPVGGAWAALGPQPIKGLSTFGDSAGRVTALAANGTTVYAGAAGGGVWKSTDSGAHWTPLTDNQATLAIGAMAVDWSTTPETIYAGTGEANHCQDCLPSQGVLRSTDGGTSWTLLGQTTFTAGTFFVEAMTVDHPALMTARVLAATNRGLYRSTDAGSTWTQVLTGETDAVVQDPVTATRFWAAQADHLCGTSSGSLRGSVAVSADSGATWTTQVTFSSLPAAVRIGLGVGTSGTAYAAVAACPTTGPPSFSIGQLAGIEKTTNGGTSWSTLPTAPPDYFAVGSPPVGYQGWYDNVVGVDPTDPTHAVFGGVTMLATTDGGTSFADVAKPYSGGPLHPDFHAIAFTGAGAFFTGNDGGVYRTTDLGGTGAATDWTNDNATLSITQFYSGTAPDLGHVIGGSQDNGTTGIVPGGPAQPAWRSLLDGDGGWTAQIPNASTMYAEAAGLDMVQVDSSTGKQTEIGPCPLTAPSPDPSCQDPVAFIAPFVRDPASGGGTERLYAGTNRVYRTTSGGLPAGGTGAGKAWSAISGDLTAGTVSTPSGPLSDFLHTMAIGSDGTSATVMSGSWFGKVFMTRNGADSTPSWVDITGTGGPGPLPAFDPNSYTGNAWITGVAVNPADSSEAWVTIGRSAGARVFHSTNAGASPTSWSDITGTIPSVVIDSIAVDPADTSTLYLGTDAGPFVWCASCGGSPSVPSWAPLGTGLPNVRVDHVSLTDSGASIVAWTHGRGAWSLAHPTPVPHAMLSPTALTFPNQQLGTTSPPQPITLTSSGPGTLLLKGIGATGDFGQTNNCPAVLPPPPAANSCTINVTFTPTAGGTRTGSVTVADNAGDSPQRASLTGNSPEGYWLVAKDGGIFTFGNATFFGSTGSVHLNQPIVGMARTPDDGGYWLVASDGGIFTFGNSTFFGSTGSIALNQPVVGMAATPDGQGYWLVAKDGGIFTFGNATFFGSTGSIALNQPIVGMAATPDGKGYWLVAKDGGIFTFGDASFFGSTGSVALNQPIVGMAATSDGKGYWLVAADGGVFTFGHATFYGSTGNLRLNKPVVGMAATHNDGGYWFAASDGGVFTFGNAEFLGSMGGTPLNQPVVGMAAS